MFKSEKNYTVMMLKRMTTAFVLVVGVLCAFFLGKIIYLGEDVIGESLEIQDSVVDPLYTLVLAMLVLSTVLVLAFSLFQVISGCISNKNQLKKIVIFVIGAGAIYFVSYTLASDQVITFLNGDSSTALESKWTGTGVVICSMCLGVWRCSL